MTTEKRKKQRKIFSSRVELISQENITYVGISENITQGGIGVILYDNLKLNDVYTIKFGLIIGDGEKKITALGRLVHSKIFYQNTVSDLGLEKLKQFRIGFKFIDINEYFVNVIDEYMNSKNK